MEWSPPIQLHQQRRLDPPNQRPQVTPAMLLENGGPGYRDAPPRRLQGALDRSKRAETTDDRTDVCVDAAEMADDSAAVAAKPALWKAMYESNHGTWCLATEQIYTSKKACEEAIQNYYPNTKCVPYHRGAPSE